MHIGIDGKPLTIAHPCGIKHYAFELINAIGNIDKQNQYTVFLPKKIDLPRYKNIVYIFSKFYMPWQLTLPIISKKYKFDYFMYLTQHGSVFLHHKRLITIVHDVSPTSNYPEITRDPYFYFLGRYTSFIKNIILKKSCLLIAISNFTKSELIKSNYDQRKIFVVHSGISQKFLQNKIKKRKSLILSMTDFSPRKNIETTIKAFSLLPMEIKKKHKLTIIISMNHMVDYVYELLQKHNIHEFSQIIISPAFKELLDLYDRSLIFCYPSLYEGFGLPILEAMARHCVVITSNQTATKEISGNAAIQIDPSSPEEIAKAIQEVIKNKKMRNKYVKRGNEKIKQYSWMKTAENIIEILKNHEDKNFEK